MYVYKYKAYSSVRCFCTGIEEPTISSLDSHLSHPLLHAPKETLD